MRAFLASKVSSKKQRLLNEKLGKLFIRLKIHAFLPQNALPYGTKLSPLKILETNERAIDKCDLGIIVFDRAGAGTAMELERAHMLGKPMIGYRSEASRKNEYLGKMLSGAWERIPDGMRVSDLEELEGLLTKLKEAAVALPAKE